MNNLCSFCWNHINQERLNLNLDTCLECAKQVAKIKDQKIKMEKLYKIPSVEQEKDDVVSMDKVYAI
jgi:hypothetical protein